MLMVPDLIHRYDETMTTGIDDDQRVGIASESQRLNLVPCRTLKVLLLPLLLLLRMDGCFFAA